MSYSIMNFDKWVPINKQVSGANEKLWLGERHLLHIDRVGLFKYSKVNNGITSGEYWAEKMASDIIRAAGMSCMQVDMGTRAGRLGCMCYDFTEVYGSFAEMQDIIMTQHPDIPEGKYTLESLDKSVSRGVFNRIVLMLVLDFLIGNNDRHSGNFAVLHAFDTLAPLYDNGSSLCCRVNPSDVDSYVRDRMRYEAFVFNRPESFCIDNTGKPYKLNALMRELSQSHSYAFIKALDSVSMLSPSVLDGLLSKFVGIVDQKLLNFINKVITDRLKFLKELS